MGTAYRTVTGDIFVVALAAALAVACERERERAASGIDTASPAAAEAARSDTGTLTRVNVRLGEWTIEQSEDSLARGPATFAVENTGTMPHSLEISGRNGTWSSPPIPPAGGTVLMSMVMEPGAYELSCPDDAGAHKTRGIQGKITVY